MAERPLVLAVLRAGDPALLCGPFPGPRCKGRAGGRAAPCVAARRGDLVHDLGAHGWGVLGHNDKLRLLEDVCVSDVGV